MKVMFWRYNKDKKQWELVLHAPHESLLLGVVTDEMLTDTVFSEDDVIRLITEGHPEWSPFPDKRKRELIMSRNKDPESFSAGSRTDRDHAPDGWQLGGRKEAEISTPYDPQLAAQHVQDHQDRQAK